MHIIKHDDRQDNTKYKKIISYLSHCHFPPVFVVYRSGTGGDADGRDVIWGSSELPLHQDFLKSRR